ncbi:hypothetical protein VNO78_31138 [Psophocarpus tetragonolobus]|uniref:Uncharacterized protein n=1 Tax=Psophocarpus tetragonolobus TaxID=3891 RepID=A0AAN9RXX9_PSOTE
MDCIVVSYENVNYIFSYLSEKKKRREFSFLAVEECTLDLCVGKNDREGSLVGLCVWENGRERLRGVSLILMFGQMAKGGP